MFEDFTGKMLAIFMQGGLSSPQIALL